MIWLPHIIGGLGLILIAIIIATSIALRIISKKERAEAVRWGKVREIRDSGENENLPS